MRNRSKFASWLSDATVGNTSFHLTANISLALITNLGLNVLETQTGKRVWQKKEFSRFEFSRADCVDRQPNGS